MFGVAKQLSPLIRRVAAVGLWLSIFYNAPRLSSTSDHSGRTCFCLPVSNPFSFFDTVAPPVSCTVLVLLF